VSARYEFIDEEKARTTNGGARKYTIVKMCEWMEVSTSGFYEWLNRPASATAKRRDHLKLLIEKAFTDSDGTYGYRRLHAQLARWNEHCTPELVRALMRALGLVACQPRPWRHNLTESGPSGPIPDLVARDFTAAAPGTKMVGDITYIPTWHGLRSCEVLALEVADADIGGGWLRVWGKGSKERRVPLDTDVAKTIQVYLLAERPESDSARLFLVAKGPNRGQPLSPAGLRTVFRYHRQSAGVAAGHPHALRHSFGTALAEAGVDLAVMRDLLGHTHIDTTTRYIHLAPTRVKKEFDAARARSRAQR